MSSTNPTDSRERYVRAWNDTMIKIWHERIALMGAIDTGTLYNSVVALPIRADGRFYDFTLSQSFMQYGIYVDRGVGKEFGRGNPGDVNVVQRKRRGRQAYRGQREIRPWFTKSYYHSIRNLTDFLAQNMGREFVAMFRELES